MTDRSLSQEINTTGEWFLPENPEQRIPGSLSCSLGRTSIHLNNSFRPINGDIVAEHSESYPLVHGITREQDAVTIINAVSSGFQFHIGTGGKGQPETLVTNVLLVGAHLSADFAYHGMRFRIPGLQAWLSRPIISRTLESDLSVTMRIHRIPDEPMGIPSIAATLNWKILTTTGNIADHTAIEVASTGWLEIQPDKPQPLEWFLEQQNRVTTLLSFLAGETMSIDCITASVGERPRDVSVMVGLQNSKCCSITRLADFFMPRVMMGVEFFDVLSRWFEVYPTVDNPSQLALSVFSSETLWTHIEFLSLIQALEGYHRARFPGDYMEEAQYEMVKSALGAAILANVSADHKASLRSRIRYGNQFSLRKRLNDLAAQLDLPIRRMILGGDGSLPNSWVDTRNYYTHWDEELRANLLNTQEMYNANVRLKHFVRALYLQLVGIPPQAIFRALTNNCSSSQHLIQLNNPGAVLGRILTVVDEQDQANQAVHSNPNEIPD